MSSPQESIREKVERTKNGKPRATRPDGSYYSTDPKERHAQLVEDGKIGAKGSELARAHGKLGGRPRHVSAQALVAEKAREDAEAIYAGLRAGLDSESVKQQRDSATAILDYEEKYFRRQEREAKQREGIDKDKIIAMLVDKLMSDSPMARQMREHIEQGVIDADFVEPAALPSGGAD